MRKIVRRTGIVEIRWDSPVRTISLGRREHLADTWIAHLRSILERTEKGHPLTADTENWLISLSRRDYQKLERHGLVPPKEDLDAERLFGLCDAWLGSRTVKPSSIEVYRKTIRNLQIHFSNNPYVARITPRAADGFWDYLLKRGGLRGATALALTTATKRMCTARDIGTHAVKLGLVTKNPFAKQRHWQFEDTDERRKVEVKRDWIMRILDVCPDLEFRAILCCARFAGMRVPSEVFALRWSDVIWDRKRIMLDAPKTGLRPVPLFPELQKSLSELYESLPDGASQWVVAQHRDKTGTALRNKLEMYCKYAGIVPWPRLWHNQRATVSSELFARRDPHVVCEWLGYSPRVAVKHYTRAREADYEAETKPTPPPKKHTPRTNTKRGVR